MRPSIYFSQSIDERSWHVWRPVVKLGEHRSRFFFYVDSADADERQLITPPRGLYGKEFLELDHRDVFQLMEFQKRWGPITGLRAQPNKTFERGTYPNVTVDESFYREGHNPIFHPEGITQTVFLYEGMGEIDVIARERFGVENNTLHKVVEENWRRRRKDRRPDVNVVPCHVASVEEVAEAVCDAQVAIRAITNTLRDGYTDTDWKNDRRLVLECMRYCNAVLAGSVTPVDIIEEGDRNGVCTLMQYLFISLAKGVMLNNAFRFCQNPECGRLFTPKEYDRRADSRYCSEDCQIKAKYLRTFRNSRKSPSTWSSVDQGPESTSIEVTWSTSDIPIRTLRREQVELPGDDREPTRGSNIEQLLFAQSFIGLTTGWVRTAEILEELKSR